MPRGLRRIIFSGMLLAVLICVLSFSASAFTYQGSVNDIDLNTFSVNIGGTTLPLSQYPDGSVTPFSSLSESNYANYMTVADGKLYGLSLSGNLWLRSAECMAFSRYVYAALYYKYPATATMDNYIANAINPYGSYAYIDKISSPWGGGTYTASQFEAIVKSCYPGSFIRQGGHSMVIMAIFNDGLIVYDANGMGNYNEVDVRKYTWQGYINKYGARTIYALQVPSYYPGYTYSTGSSGGGAYDYDLDTSKAGTYQVVNVSTSLNVRSGPGTSFAQVGKVSAGTQVDVLGTYSGWAAINYNGSVCWLSLDYLQVISLKVTVDGYTLDTSKAGTYQVNSPNVGYLNVREKPGTYYTMVGTVAHGSVVEVIGTYSGWAAISFNGAYRWVSMDYLVAYTGEITVTFDAGGGYCTLANQVYKSGTTFGSLPTPVKSERVFLGWYYGEQYMNSDSAVPTTDITLTAKWGVKSYVDVDDTAWYANAVEYVYDSGIMSGSNPNQFLPDMTLNRASAAQILYNMMGRPDYTVDTATYTDVSPDDWYYKAVEWCTANKLVQGNGYGQYMPGDEISRQDFVLILFRFANYLGKGTSARADLSSFPDSGSIKDYGVDAVQWAVAEGIINGRGDGTLAPLEGAQRSMIAQILCRYHKLYG